MKSCENEIFALVQDSFLMVTDSMGLQQQRLRKSSLFNDNEIENFDETEDELIDDTSKYTRKKTKSQLKRRNRKICKLLVLLEKMLKER